MIPSLFDLSFPGIVENKLAWLLDLLKVLKDVAPTWANFFSQYSINFTLDVPDTVWNFIKSDNEPWEAGPLPKIAKKGELTAFKHDGFWQCMDTKRDKDILDSFCNNGNCDLGYCLTDNPAGCFSNGCPDNFECLGYEFTNDCVASSCFCDEFYGDWFCTEDCNGGTCFELGDINYNGSVDVVCTVWVVQVVGCII